MDSQKSLTDTFTNKQQYFYSIKTMADLMTNPESGLTQTNFEQGIDIIPLNSSHNWITDMLVAKANK